MAGILPFTIYQPAEKSGLEHDFQKLTFFNTFYSVYFIFFVICERVPLLCFAVMVQSVYLCLHMLIKYNWVKIIALQWFSIKKKHYLCIVQIEQHIL